jgi:formylmethanofuran dehydrogenase subunit E
MKEDDPERSCDRCGNKFLSSMEDGDEVESLCGPCRDRIEIEAMLKDVPLE